MEFWAEFWGAFTAFIFFLIAWLLTVPLPKWIKNREEKKKLKQAYIELYQTFSNTDNLGKNILFLMIIIETKIGVQEFQKKMNMLLDIYFDPERKTD